MSAMSGNSSKVHIVSLSYKDTRDPGYVTHTGLFLLKLADQAWLSLLEEFKGIC